MSDATADAPTPFVFPRELTKPLREVLGLMIFQTVPLAEVYRDAGAYVPSHVEGAQAFMLHRLLCLALEHGEDWRRFAGEDLERTVAAAKALTGAPS
jgi:hypothetical protein